MLITDPPERGRVCCYFGRGGLRVFHDDFGERLVRHAGTLSRVEAPWRSQDENASESARTGDGGAAAGLAGFNFHELRHYYASLLIDSGASVKVVQARLGHKSAEETLNTYSHLWPDSDDRTRDAIDAVLRADSEQAIADSADSRRTPTQERHHLA